MPDTDPARFAERFLIQGWRDDGADRVVERVARGSLDVFVSATEVADWIDASRLSDPPWNVTGTAKCSRRRIERPGRSLRRTPVKLVKSGSDSSSVVSLDS